MKNLRTISFWLLLAFGLSAAVFTACSEDDEPIIEKTGTSGDTSSSSGDTTENPIAVTGISLDSATLSLTIGDEYTLTATVVPDSATDKTVSWTTSNASVATVSAGKVKAIAEGTATIIATAGTQTATCTVTIEKSNTQINADGVSGTVTDAEGNTYAIVKIGKQWWMAENLKAAKYNDGTLIPNRANDSAWASDDIGAYCSYENDAANASKYGMLYNWHAVNTGKLAPKGWHIPTTDEWISLEKYLIANGYNYDGTTSGNKIAKSLAATADWATSTDTGDIGNNSNTNNSSGFSALPGGARSFGDSFVYLRYRALWWCATEWSNALACYRALDNDYVYLISEIYDKNFGLSVRCVMD